MTRESAHAAATEAQWNLWELLSVLRKSWWLVLLLGVIGGLSATFYSLGRTKIYRASTTLQIDPDPPKPLGQEVQSVVDVGAGVVANNREYYQTQYDILRSRKLAQRTVERLALARDASFILNQPVAEVVTTGEGAPTFTPADARTVLQNRLTVEPLRDSRMVKVSFDDAEPERARRVLRTLVAIYIDDNVDSVLESTNVAAVWLEEQLQKLKGELSLNEDALYDYKKENQILSVSMDDQSNMLREEMQQLNRALTQVRTELQELMSRSEQLQNLDSEDLTDLPARELLQSSVLAGLRADLVRSEQELEALTNSGKGEKHPDVLAASAKVSISKSALVAEVRNIREALRRDVVAKRAEEVGLRGLFERAKSRALELNRLGLDYRRLERAKENTEKVYSMVLERSKESDLTRYMRFNNIRVIDEAYAEPDPVRPKTPLNIAGGSFLGLFLGFVAAFARNALDRTFKGAHDVEQHLGLPLLGVLPKTAHIATPASGGRRRHVGDELVVHQKPTSAAAEASRALRTNLLFAAPDKPQRTMVVTSGVPFEGKTTVACWVATAMAQAGKKVLLLDCDLRRPRMHKIFGRPNDNGISTFVMGEADVTSADLSTEIPNLSLITSGPSVPNPAELLQSERFHRFLETLGERYDRIVLDTPPVNSVTDAAILSTIVDGTILVVRAHATARESASHSSRTLTDVSDNLLGVVLNAFDGGKAGYGYKYGYATYGYRYYREQPTRRSST